MMFRVGQEAPRTPAICSPGLENKRGCEGGGRKVFKKQTRPSPLDLLWRWFGAAASPLPSSVNRRAFIRRKGSREESGLSGKTGGQQSLLLFQSLFFQPIKAVALPPFPKQTLTLVPRASGRRSGAARAEPSPIAATPVACLCWCGAFRRKRGAGVRQGEPHHLRAYTCRTSGIQAHAAGSLQHCSA